MSDDPAVVEETTDPSTPDADAVEKAAFLDRLNKESAKRREAEKKASTLEKRLADVEAAAKERENAGLPELERERKAREELEKRLQEAEKAREDSERQVTLSRAERLVVQAAKDFVNPDDAVRNIDLETVETAEDAERAVKRVAKTNPHYLQPDEKPLPGRVLENGRKAPGGKADPGEEVNPEAAQLAGELKRFLKA
jgi:hypothetical protein